MNGSQDYGLDGALLQRGHLRLVHSAPRPASVAWRLTGRDLVTLSEWMDRADAHGYSRVRIEAGSGGSAPEDGGYVLLYGSGQVWADWGIARGSAGLEVWHCSSGVDVGRFETMLEALESLPPVRCKEAAMEGVRIGA